MRPQFARGFGARLAEVATSAPADISRLASYTVRPSPSGDNGLSARRSRSHTEKHSA
jgi:hypothetical protein